MAKIRLDSPIACRDELQTCSNEMAALLVDFTRLREAAGVVDEQWEVIEALAAAEVQPEKGETATAIKGRVVSWVLDHPELVLIRAATYELKAELEIVERRFRNYEKRMSAAQSALKDHDAEARNAGFGGGMI